MGHLGAVLIGVSRAHELDELQAVESSVAAMHQWALSQTEAEYIVTLTDGDGEDVTVQLVMDAIDDLIEQHGISKLVVYFAGHGIYKDYSEYWLLSRAPRRGHEAVNVRGSQALAKGLGIEHVVLISDACRTHGAPGILGDVQGTAIFPNLGTRVSSGGVDLVQGCRQGRPAYEIRPPGGEYVSIFTEVLTGALAGRPDHFVSTSADGSSVVLTQTLRERLPEQMSRYLDAAGMPISREQLPDLEILSPAGAWISRLPDTPPSSGGVPAPSPDTDPSTAGEARRDLAAALLEVEARRERGPEWRDDGEPDPDRAGGWRPWSGETALTVSGDRIRRLSHAGQDVPLEWGIDAFDDERPGVSRAAFRNPGEFERRAVPIVVQLESGDVFTVVVGPDTHVGISTADGRLRSVTYGRTSRAAKVDRHLVLAVEAAAANGVFRPEASQIEQLILAMRRRKDVDPTLALYTAYALFDRSEFDELRRMRRILEDSSGYAFFDLDLLCGDLSDRSETSPPTTRHPLLTQGWPLLFALTEPEHAQQELFRRRRPGLWTSFHASAWDLLTTGGF